MSCAVALVENGLTYVACDSLILTNNRYVNEVSQPKMYKTESAIIAWAGNATFGQFLANNLFNAEAALLSDVIAYAIFLKEKIESMKVDWQFECLIATNGKIYVFDEQFYVINDTKRFNAIGSGIDYALGCMYAICNHQIDPKVKVETAILAAKAYDPYVGGKINIMVI